MHFAVNRGDAQFFEDYRLSYYIILIYKKCFFYYFGPKFFYTLLDTASQISA